MGTNLIKTVDWNESRQASRAPFRGPVAQSLTLKLSMSSLEVGGKEKKKQNKIKTQTTTTTTTLPCPFAACS